MLFCWYILCLVFIYQINSIYTCQTLYYIVLANTGLVHLSEILVTCFAKFSLILNCSLTFLFLVYRIGTQCGLLLVYPTSFMVWCVILYAWVIMTGWLCELLSPSYQVEAVRPFLSDLWDQQGIFIQRNALTGCFLLFRPFSINTRDQPIWHQQSFRVIFSPLSPILILTLNLGLMHWAAVFWLVDQMFALMSSLTSLPKSGRLVKLHGMYVYIRTEDDVNL